jgi:hypothetical protein
MALFNILVDIAARTASFDTGIKSVNDKLTHFGEVAEHVKQALEAIGFAEALHKVSEFTLETIELGDKLNSAATKAGVATEAFTQLAYAAKLNSVSSDSLSSAFVKMNVALSNAATGGKEQIDALAALGLTYKELKALAPEDQFTIIADRINKLATSADKSRAEVVLFGKAGGDLAGLFSKGADGILRAREEAERIGQSFSEETLKGFEEAHQSIDRLEQSFSALSLTLVGKVAPALSHMLDSITALTTGDELLKLKDQINSLTNISQGGGFYQGFSGGFNVVKSQQNALDEANRLKAQLALQTSSLVVNPNSLKLGGLLKGSAPGFQPNPNDVLQPFHSTLGREQLGSGKINPVVQQYLDDTAALTEAGGRASDEFNKTSAELKAILQDNSGFLDEYNQRMEAARQKFNDAIDIEPLIVNMRKLPQVLSEGEQRALTFVGDVQSAFANAAEATGAFGQNLLKSLLQAFENRAIFNAIESIGEALQKALGVGAHGSLLNSILGGFIGAVGGGADIANYADSAATDYIDTYNAGAFGGPKAAGGPLEMGKWYIAGEKGPEPVWGGGPGAFASGYGSGGGAPTVHINNSIDARGASFDLIKALPAILRKNNESLESKIVTGLARNKYKL